eukprot:gb/GECH01014493.1/.p1 GENE.gb/GECH01014493.1/~~gb/GECH01014493.1/.p1  ORF type:complete len:125 (+),score=44.41 gb/GECH01014493.1/:1-375(+)
MSRNHIEEDPPDYTTKNKNFNNVENDEDQNDLISTTQSSPKESLSFVEAFQQFSSSCSHLFESTFSELQKAEMEIQDIEELLSNAKNDYQEQNIALKMEIDQVNEQIQSFLGLLPNDLTLNTKN